MTLPTIHRIVEIDSPFLCPYHSRVGSIYICQHPDAKKDGYLKTCEKQDGNNPFPIDCVLTEITISNDKPTVQVPEKEKPHGGISNIGMGHSWSKEEDDIISQTGNRPEAIDLYRRAYPLSDRTDVAIEKRYNRVMLKMKKENPDRWIELHQPTIEEKPIVEVEDVATLIDNRNDWQPAEIESILTCLSANDAVHRYDRNFYAHKFAKKRPATEIINKWNELLKANKLIRENDRCRIIKSVAGFDNMKGTVTNISEDGHSVSLNITTMTSSFVLQVPVSDIERCE